MNYYFSLQFKRIVRWFEAAEINPLIGFVLCGLLFIGGSLFLFYKTEFASWIYVFIALSACASLIESQRTFHLKSIFPNEANLKIRVLEQLAVVLPFVVFLLFKICYVEAALALFGGVSLAFFSTEVTWTKVIPTPFKRFPFEFIVGFRKTYIVILFCYFLLYKSITFANFNLGIASLGALFLVGMSFYLLPEHRHFVWVFSKKVGGFVISKTIDAFISMGMLILPMVLILWSYNTAEYLAIFTITVLGYLFLFAVVVAKYSAYPHEISFPQVVLFGLCLWLPPMILLAIPIFYKKAKKNLKPILE